MNAPLACLVDRNVVTEMMRLRPEPQVMRFLDSVANRGLSTASFTVREVLDGVNRLATGWRRNCLFNRFQNFSMNCSRIGSSTGLRLVPGNARADSAREAHARRAARRPVPDGFLADTAASRALTAVTRKARELCGTGLDTADPWTVEVR